jgi:pimeloyl-ACP methyl ester carboxylesterase
MDRLASSMFPNGLTPPFEYGGADIASVVRHMQSLECGLVYPSRPTADAVALFAKLQLGPDRGLMAALNPDLGGGYQDNDRVGHTDFIPLLATFKDKVFAAYGDEDRIFNAHQLETIETTISTAHFAMIPGASHFPFVDQNKTFVDVVAKHLDALK